MAGASTQFFGSIPEACDSGLGPVLFHDHGADLARRAAEGAPADAPEIAAGTGIVSRLVRDLLPAEAPLVVSDLNAPMLEVARRKFRPGERVEFVEADALDLPFPDASFDLLLCQFGVMFFPDKPQAFREARRVLRPGGRLLFNVWTPISANPFAAVNDEVMTRLYPADTPGFYRVPFSYGDAAAARADLAAAGWRDARCETIATLREVADPAGFARAIVYGNPLILEILERGGDPDAAVAAILAGYKARFGVRPMTMPLEVLLFDCRAP